jgi:hypothetical protein
MIRPYDVMHAVIVCNACCSVPSTFSEKRPSTFYHVQFPLVNSFTFVPTVWGLLTVKAELSIDEFSALRGLSHARALNQAQG